MDVVTVIELVSAVCLVAGLLFAARQVRQFRIDRDMHAALELVHSFQTPAIARAMILIGRLPDGLSMDEIETRFRNELDTLHVTLTMWESLGVLVFRRQVSLDVVDDFYSGLLVLSWQKLRGYVEGIRAEVGRETYYEWFQWLAERMIEREAYRSPIPAHRQHANWKPGGLR